MTTVDDLLQRAFTSRTSEEKLAIVCAGKPRPLLKPSYLSTIAIGSKDEFVFDVAIYDQEVWLTGCEKRHTLFCWPCLLFVGEHTQWNTTGFSNFTFFQDGLVRHRNSKPHAQGMLSLTLFNYQNFPAPREPVTQRVHEEVVKRNREIAKRITDAICIVVSQLCLSCKGTNITKYLRLEDCVDILSFLKEYESNTDDTSDAIDFLKSSPNVLPHFVSAIASVVKEDIKQETKQSTFVSLVLNEHSDIAFKSRISTVFRYLKDGKVCEKFAGFSDISKYKSSQVIYELISRLVEEYDIAERFVAYSVDGAVLASSYHMNPLKAKLRDDYPFSYFVPCYFHDLDLVLEQSLLHIKECKQFFKNINSIKSFFASNSNACSILTRFLNVSIDGLDRDEWSNSQFLRLLKTHRRQFIKFFESVVASHEYWEAEDIPKALAFQHILREFDTVFQLVSFFKIFDLTSTLRHILSSHIFETAIGSDLPEFLKSTLNVERGEAAFEIFWLEVVGEMFQEHDDKPPSLRAAMEPEAKLLHREFYLKVIDSVVQDIEYRFGSLADLLFFNILNCERYGKFVLDKDAIKSLLSVHEPYFEEDALENEMKVLCVNNTVFKNKSLYDLMELFISLDLKVAFKNLFLLAELTLTMPCKPASADGIPSKLEKINAWSFATDNKDCSNELRLLCIEEETLEELRNKPEFFDKIFQNFQKINNTLNLV